MNNNSDFVTSGKPKATGAIHGAPAGTAIPVDAATPLNTAFKNLGYISEDGVTNAIESDIENAQAWGGDTVMVVQTSYNETYAFTCIETNVTVLSEYFGEDNVTAVGANLTIKHTGQELKEHPWVIETVLKDGRIQRSVIPKGKISERGEITFKDDEPISYEMTISALPDAEGGTAYTYIAAPEED